MKYPEHWPKPNPDKPKSLPSIITEQQKEDLYNRRITTTALAKELNVSFKWLSYTFTGKVPIHDKRPLIQARREYRILIACDVLKGKYSIIEAAKIVFCSRNTMQRYINKAKAKYPELVKK